MKTAFLRCLCLIIALLFLTSCGQSAVPTEEVSAEITEETIQEEEEVEETLPDDTNEFMGYEDYNPMADRPEDTREKSFTALKQELEDQLAKKDFPDYAKEMYRQALDKLYQNYEYWTEFVPDLPEKHTYIRRHLVDILPDIKKINCYEEGTPEFDEYRERLGFFAGAFSDGEELSFLGVVEPEEDGQYAIHDLKTLLHETQHIRQSNIFTTDYFNSDSYDYYLKYFFIEGGATYYSFFLDDPLTEPDSDYMPSDPDRSFEYNAAFHNTTSYGDYTENLEKLIFFVGYQPVEDVFMAEPLPNLKKALAKQYGVDLAKRFLHSLEQNYFFFPDGTRDPDSDEDMVIYMDRLFNFEQVCVELLEKKMDNIHSKEDVRQFMKDYVYYKTFLMPYIQISNYYTQDRSTEFLGLNRIEKRLTALIEQYAVLHFSDDPNFNSLAIQALLSLHSKVPLKDLQCSYTESDDSAKLYIQFQYNDLPVSIAYYIRPNGEISFRSYQKNEDYLFGAPDDGLLFSEVMELEWFPISHFEPSGQKGKVYTKWKNVKAIPITFTGSRQKQITIGSYPQSRVKDKAIIQKLNALSLTWEKELFFAGYYGETEKDIYCSTAEATLNGKKYRGLKFSFNKKEYEHMYNTSSDNPDTVFPIQPNVSYWFSYDPLTWRVLDPESGLVLCNLAIDYQNTHEEGESVYDDDGRSWVYTDKAHEQLACRYDYSPIRSWLNNTFLPVAFSPKDQKKIRTTTITTKSYSSFYPQLSAKDLHDRVFLPSVEDMINPKYGFSSQLDVLEPDRTFEESDYAFYASFTGTKAYATIILRTLGSYQNRHSYVNHDGCVFFDEYCNNQQYICPAMYVDMSAF